MSPADTPVGGTDSSLRIAAADAGVRRVRVCARRANSEDSIEVLSTTESIVPDDLTAITEEEAEQQQRDSVQDEDHHGDQDHHGQSAQQRRPRSEVAVKEELDTRRPGEDHIHAGDSPEGSVAAVQGNHWFYTDQR